MLSPASSHHLESHHYHTRCRPEGSRTEMGPPAAQHSSTIETAVWWQTGRAWVSLAAMLTDCDSCPGGSLITTHADRRGPTRREVLAAGLAATGMLVAGRPAVARPTGASEGDYGPFKMGLQSYSLRGYTTEGHADLKKALAATKELGVHYWEAFPAHVPLTDDREKIKAVKDELEASGVHVDGWGVVGLGKDEADDRKVFEFARALGLGYLTVDPDPDSFDLLDELVEEYGIPIGIHNHGPGHKYALIYTIARSIKDHSLAWPRPAGPLRRSARPDQHHAGGQPQAAPSRRNGRASDQRSPHGSSVIVQFDRAISSAMVLTSTGLVTW